MRRFLLLPALLCLAGGCADKPGATFTRSVVLTHPVRIGTEEVKHFSGVVQENHNISLGFKTAGQLEEILIKEGDPVKRGQLIARLDDTDYRLAVEALEIQCRQLEDEVERTRVLYAAKSVSANDYEKAMAGLQQLKVQLQANRNKLAYTSLYAPTDGRVQSVNFAPAEMVDAGTPVINLLDVHRLEVEVELPAEVYLQRTRFHSISCRPPFGDTDSLPMQLASIAPKANGNQLYRVRLAFQHVPDARLSAGMNIGVTFRIAGSDTTSAAFALPLHSLVQHEGNTCVWVWQPDSTVSRRQVTCSGLNPSGDAVITSGLTGNEQVVKAGANALQEGEKVQVAEQESETNVGGLI